MSGDKLKTDKADKIWFKLNLDPAFKKDLTRLRAYYTKAKSSDLAGYYFRRELMLEKHGVLPSQRLRNLCDKAVLGKADKELGEHLPFVLQTPSEGELNKRKRAFVKLWIYDGVTRDETIAYIKKRWAFIGRLLATQGQIPAKGVREVRSKKLIQAVLKLDKLSTIELRRRSGMRRGYRYQHIRKLIEKQHPSTSADSVRGIITRYGSHNQA